MFNHTVEPHYRGMRRNVLAQIASGRLTEDFDLSKVLDSLELVQLTVEVEESGVEPAVEIRTVRDFLWLCKAMNFSRQRDHNSGSKGGPLREREKVKSGSFSSLEMTKYRLPPAGAQEKPKKTGAEEG